MQINMLSTKFTKLPIAIVIGFAIVLCSHIGYAQRVINIDHKGTKLTTGNTVTEAATAPTSPTPIEGDIWLDTTNNLTKIFDGTTWKPIDSETALSLRDTNLDTKIQVEESTNEDKIRFDTAGSERVIIDETGKVGIGTSAPSVELHVNGKTRVETIDEVTDPSTYSDYRVLAADTAGEVHSINAALNRKHTVRYSSDGGGLTAVPQGVLVHVYITMNCQSSKARAVFYRFDDALVIISESNTVNFGSWSGSGTDTLTVIGNNSCGSPVTHTITISGADIIHTSDNPGYSSSFSMNAVY
jgi:hypothetical protein